MPHAGKNYRQDWALSPHLWIAKDGFSLYTSSLYNMRLFSRKGHRAVGIDIGSGAVKLLEVTVARGGYRAERCAIEPLARNAVVEHGISDLEQTSDALRRALRNSRTRRKKAVVAVSSTHVVSRKISLPAGLSEAEIEQQVMIEAAQHIPHPLEEVNLDYRVTGGARSGNDDEIMITACRKEIVEDYVAVVEAAGLSAAIVDVGGFAVERGFAFVAPTLAQSLEGKVVALIDFGDVTTHLDVFHNGTVIYSRDQNFGGRILTENVRARYGIGYPEAEAAKRSGELPQNYEVDLLEPFRSSMAREVARGIEFFLSAGRGYGSVDALLVCGGCGQLPGVAEVIEAHAGIPTVIANPFAPGSRITAGKAVQKQASLLLKAVGLAIRGAG